MVKRALRWCASFGWPAALVRLVAVAALSGLLLIGLCAMVGLNLHTTSRSPWFAASVLFPAVALSLGLTARPRAWWLRLDNRVGDMLLATMLAIGLTLLGLLLGTHDPSSPFATIFDGWMASVLFWAFVGLIVAIVSLARAEDEGYGARARILFRGEAGRHIDYIVEALCGTIGHYAVRIARDITIREFHPDAAGGAGWFLLELESTMTLRAYVEDAETVYTSKAEYTNANTPPPGGRPARIVRAACLHVDGTTTHPKIVDHPNGHTIEYTTRFNRPGTCTFTVHREYWVREGEENVYELGRFTLEVSTRIRNLCANVNPVSMDRQLPPSAVRIPLQRDQGWNIISIDQDRKPDQIVHDFSLYS